MKAVIRGCVVVMLTTAGFPAVANDALEGISNYREYSDVYSSAGQPTSEQFQAIKDAGFERVIYIAFSNGRTAIANEDELVKELGMDYVHIPVVWDNPTKADFAQFVAAISTDPTRRTLLHCQVNFRASAFSFLYRVLHLNVPVAIAKTDMNTVWHPDETWRDFIFSVLDDHDVSPDCEGCSWEQPE